MKVVIIGASHAGISAAINLSKLRSRYSNSESDFEIVLIEQNSSEGFSFVGANGIFWVKGEISADKMGYTTPEYILNRKIDLHFNTKVDSINSKDKVIIATNKETSQNCKINYDYLVLATGSSAITPDELESEFQNKNSRFLTMKSYADAIRINDICKDPKINRVAIIGGGYIGVELAETICNFNKDVTIFHSQNQLMNSYYDPDFSDLVEKILIEHKVKLVKNTRFDILDEKCQKFDVFIFAIGFKPNSNLLNDELELFKNAYKVDQYCTTSNPFIFAIGDVSTSYSNILDNHIYLPIGSATAREASIVADVMFRKISGEESEIKNERIVQRNNGVQGSNALTIFNLNIASTGITSEYAKQYGFNVQSLEFTGSILSKEFNNPFICSEASKSANNNIMDKNDMKIKIIYETNTRRILGFQCATYSDPSAYCHMFSLAISKKMVLDDIKNLDLFFSPLINQLYNQISRALSRI